MYQLRESTKIRCGHCNIVAYCSTECLFSTHIAGGDDCNDLGIGKIVMRAANILSQAYLTFREHTLDGQAVKIGLIGNECAAYGNINISSTVQLFDGILDTLMTVRASRAVSFAVGRSKSRWHICTDWLRSCCLKVGEPLYDDSDILIQNSS
jgi:hypothetical protein